MFDFFQQKATMIEFFAIHSSLKEIYMFARYMSKTHQI